MPRPLLFPAVIGFLLDEASVEVRHGRPDDDTIWSFIEDDIPALLTALQRLRQESG